MSVENEISTVGKVTDDVQDEEADFKDHDTAQKVETHLNLRPDFAPKKM